ncbi:host cell division inhibitor Icd-like protein [Enterobacter hormaechei]|nr:host cell division inhibitor Icd-like protein [Enterobacter hormaechei]QFI02081.1 host cell division inhibitor Icd-like protein [Enterobacter hormaechei]
MIHKTKAAMQGRQCHYQKLKQSQDTRVNAGGQSLSAPVIAGTAPLARLRETTQKLGCLGCTALAHTPFPQIWGELDQRAGCAAMQHTPGKSRSFGRYPDIGYHSLSAYLAFLRWSSSRTTLISCPISSEALTPIFSTCASVSREETRIFSPFPSAWRRAISPRMAATMNAALLSSFRLTDSIPSMTSCGMRAVNDCDFVFLGPVAICNPPYAGVRQYTQNKSYTKALTCKPPKNKVTYTLIDNQGTEKTKPAGATNTDGPLTKPLSEVTAMAFKKSTQTRPEFTWRFLSASERYPTAKPLVIYVNASSEQEARDTMPGVNLIFAARLPFHAFQLMEVRHA